MRDEWKGGVKINGNRGKGRGRRRKVERQVKKNRVKRELSEGVNENGASER